MFCWCAPHARLVASAQRRLTVATRSRFCGRRAASYISAAATRRWPSNSTTPASRRVLFVSARAAPVLTPTNAQDVTNLDYSAACVEHMRARNATARPRLRFEVADCRALTLPPATYDVVLDKARARPCLRAHSCARLRPTRTQGLLDAMVCCTNAEAGVTAMLDAVATGLVPGGCFVLVSYGAPPQRLSWVAPAQRGWQARAVHILHMLCRL